MKKKSLNLLFKNIQRFSKIYFYIFTFSLLLVIILFELFSLQLFLQKADVWREIFSQKIHISNHSDTKNFSVESLHPFYQISPSGIILKSSSPLLKGLSIAKSPLFHSFCALKNNLVIFRLYPNLLTGKKMLYRITRQKNNYQAILFNLEYFFPVHLTSPLFLATDSKGVCFYSSNPNLIGTQIHSPVLNLNQQSIFLFPLKPFGSNPNIHLYAGKNYWSETIRLIVILLVFSLFLFFYFYNFHHLKDNFTEMNHEYIALKNFTLEMEKIKLPKDQNPTSLHSSLKSQFAILEKEINSTNFQFTESKGILLLIKSQNKYIQNLLKKSQKYTNSLEKNELRLKTLLSSAKDIAFITLEFDSKLMDFMISDFSTGAEELFGYTSIEAMNDSFFEYLLSPSDPFYQTLLHFTESEESNTKGELQIQTRENIQKIVLYAIQKITSKLFLLTMVDITLLKNTQKLLNLEKKQFHALLTNLREGVLKIDKERIVHYINPEAEKLLNCSSEEILYQKIEKFYKVRTYTNPTTKTQDTRSWETVGKDSINYRQAELIREDGRSFFLSEKTSLIYNEKGKLENIILILEPFVK